MHVSKPHDLRCATASITRPRSSAPSPERVGRVPRSVRRRTALALTLATLALLLIWIGGSLVIERLVYHPRRSDIGPPPSARGWTYQDVSFRDQAGLTLRRWWIPRTGGPTLLMPHRPPLLMAHGWTSSRRQPHDESGYLHAAGYNLLLFDFRGHGQSDGSYTTLGWAEPDDLRAAIDFAHSRSPGTVGVIGYSMGAVAA